jgi:NADPH:quinone reductase-like Zn-dependent oxidoreductase
MSALPALERRLTSSLAAWDSCALLHVGNRRTAGSTLQGGSIRVVSDVRADAVGGVGSIAIQLAKHLGAHVAATARSEDVEFVRKLGADQVIDTNSHAFEDTVGQLDAVLDTVGGEMATKSYSVIRGGGVLVSMVAQPDETLMRETGVTAISQVTQPTTERLTKLAALVDEGVITPRVDRVFPLERVADAFVYRETGKARGKVVVTVEEWRARG